MWKKTLGWLWNKCRPLNMKGLYAWLGDTLQKIGIAGIALALYQNSTSGLWNGLGALGISAIIILTQRKQ